MRRLRLATTLLGLAITSLAACSGVQEDETGSSGDELAVSGRWVMPPPVANAASRVRLEYDGAPRWSSRACAGQLKSGADRLGEFLQDEFTAVRSVGGYACRQNTANRAMMSVHGTGRALDVFIPKVNGKANNVKGDVVANWLVSNSARIGVQMVIWDRSVWMPNGKSDKPYSGPHPHDDHLHVELTVEGAAMQTAWFANPTLGDGGTPPEADAAAPDASTTTDAGTRVDSSAPKQDAGTKPPPPPPPPPPPDPEPDPEPDPAPKTDTPAPDDDEPEVEPAPTGESDLPSEGTEEPLPDDEPAENESVGPKSSKPRRTAGDEEAIASSGCSAAPTSPTTTSASALGLGIMLAASLLRRRRR